MIEFPAWKKRKFHYDVLGLILCAALFLRLWHLGSVQRWTGDQSSFYNIVMNWFQDGVWPLLGPWRSISSDFGIGPGWYYTVTPALVLTGYNLAAGAATIALFGTVTIGLYFAWVRRISGSTLAALATAIVFAFSAGWVGTDRVLWNPHVMPFSVIAMALIIDGLERRPVRFGALFIMLVAILPQWHSSGIPIAVAAFPPALVALIRGRKRIREASRREWLGCGLALAVYLAFLYIPPIIYEFLPGSPGNLRNYLKNSMIPSPPQTRTWAERLEYGTKRIIELCVGQTFAPPLRRWQKTPAHWAAAVCALTFLLVGGRYAWRRWRRLPMSIVFLIFILGGHWLMLVLNGENVLDYFILPAMAVPALLTAFTAGRLLTDPEALPRPLAEIGRVAGAFILVFGLSLTAQQLSVAWGISQGRVSYGATLGDSKAICRYIVDDAAGRPSSMLFTDAPRNSWSYMHVMLRTMGLRTRNGGVGGFSLRRPSARENLGERLYLIVRGGLKPAPIFQGGPAFPLGKPAHVADAWIFCIPIATLPPGVKTLFLDSKAPDWFIKVNTP